MESRALAGSRGVGEVTSSRIAPLWRLREGESLASLRFAMRPVLSRCPNYSQCLLGYRGEDIEVFEGMVPVCPECGTPLEPKKQPRTALVPMLVNWLTIAMLATAAWFAWPFIVKGWKKITTPPTEEAPAANPR